MLRTLRTGSPGYEVMPATDTPAGVGGIFLAKTFDAASTAQKQAMLEALLAAENPLTHAPGTAACVACHTATVLFEARSKASDVDLKSLKGGYTGPCNLAIDAGKLPTSERTLRALGYLHNQPMISRRVANETCQVLSEIAQRFP